jgi:CheY-like chemotaxis protein
MAPALHADIQRSPHVRPSFQDLHALILIDDAFSRADVSRALKSVGMKRITEGSASAGYFRGNVPFPASVDVIVSDIQLRLGNGLKLLKAVRSGKICGIRQDTCFIFVTAMINPAAVSAAAQLHVNGYIGKPIVLTRLKEALLRGGQESRH